MSFAYLRPTFAVHFQMTNADYGFASGLFYTTYIVFQIPATILISRLKRPQLFLAFICFGWGATSAAIAIMPTLLHFNACRFLLGIFEAGAYPCMWYYISTLIPPAYHTITFVFVEAGMLAG